MLHDHDMVKKTLKSNKIDIGISLRGLFLEKNVNNNILMCIWKYFHSQSEFGATNERTISHFCTQ